MGAENEHRTIAEAPAMEILKAAIEKVGALDPAKVSEYMYSGVPFKTVLGDISFDKKGDITRPDYVLYTWKKQPDGKITYVTE